MSLVNLVLVAKFLTAIKIAPKDLLTKDSFVDALNTEEVRDTGHRKNVKQMKEEKAVVKSMDFFNILNANPVILTLDAVFADQQDLIAML